MTKTKKFQIILGVLILSSVFFIGGILFQRYLGNDKDEINCKIDSVIDEDEVNYKIETIIDKEIKDPFLYVNSDAEDIYLIGINNIYIDGKEMKNVYNNSSISNLIEEMNYKEVYEEYTIYRDYKKVSNNGLSILKCNNKKVYIGPSDMDFDSAIYDIENEKNGETFIRTYKVLNVAESNEEAYLYLTIRQYQFEEVVTVKVKRELCPDVSEGNSYEFTFRYTSKLVKDNTINEIFGNTDLIKIVYTDKEGMGQIQDGV